MADNMNGSGYEYIISLCEAINKFTKQEESKNPSVFIYKKSNLRFAFERALYFNYARNSYFFGIFKAYRAGDRSKKIIVNNRMERRLISLLCVAEEKDISIKEENLINKFKKTALCAVRYCITRLCVDKIAENIRCGINNRRQKDIHPEVLFCVQNKRIVRYLKPISSKMTAPYAYVTFDKEIAEYLRNENMPFIYLSKFGYPLERWSKKKNALYKFVITDKYDLLYDSLNRIKPKSVVVAEGNTSHDEIINRICKQCGIQSICIQQGWAFFATHTGFRNMTYGKMLVWGKGFARNLSRHNPDQKFIATGSHIISIKNFKTEKIFAISLFSQGKTFIINETVSREFISLAEQIIMEYPNVKVILREHPLYPFTAIEKERFGKIGVIFMSPFKYSLDEVFEKSDLTISIFSSTILESIAAGIVPIVFNPNLFPNYFPDINTMGVGIEVKNVKDAISTIKKLIKNPEEIKKYKEPMEKFRKEYFSYNKEIAINNIIRELTN